MYVCMIMITTTTTMMMMMMMMMDITAFHVTARYDVLYKVSVDTSYHLHVNYKTFSRAQSSRVLPS